MSGRIDLNVLGRPYVDQFITTLGVLEWLLDQKPGRNRNEHDAIEHVRDLVQQESRP